MISLIYAQSRNGIIGRDGSLPWHISSDLKRFKELTLGKPVIMGRKTWESLPRKPLPGRLNIVVTRQSGFVAEGAQVAGSIDEALRLAASAAEICIIGGAEVYREALPKAGRIYLTEVDLVVEGDAKAPKLDPAKWKITAEQHFPQDAKDDAAFTLRTLERL